MKLTPRERTILERIIAGDRNRDIEAALGLAHHTVQNYVAQLLDKTGMSSRLELALWALVHEGEW